MLPHSLKKWRMVLWRGQERVSGALRLPRSGDWTSAGSWTGVPPGGGREGGLHCDSMSPDGCDGDTAWGPTDQGQGRDVGDMLKGGRAGQTWGWPGCGPPRCLRTRGSPGASDQDGRRGAQGERSRPARRRSPRRAA